MTGPVAGAADRGITAPTRTSRGLGEARGILVVLALGLVFRLILAYHPDLIPGSGFRNDLDAFRAWAATIAANGPIGFYERPGFLDYTPGYLYVLWLVGVVGNAIGGIGDLIKLPAILADVALGWLAWSMTAELGGGRRAAHLAGLIVVVNPITWFDSVVWGQVDSVGVVFLLLGLRELWRDRPERAAVFAVVAAIVKPQLGILVPIVAAVTMRRALFPRGGYGDEPGPALPERTESTGPAPASDRAARGSLRILTAGVAGLLTAVLLAGGFGLSIVDLLGQVARAAGTYPYLTVNAYNPWALVELDGRGLASAGLWICDVVLPTSEVGPSCPEAVAFGPLPAVVVGSLLLLATVLAVAIVVALRPDRPTILVGLAVLALAFFVVPTRVHERYLFPFFALGAILAAVSVRWRIAYTVLSVATFANMYVVLTTLYPDNPNVRDWLGIGQQIRSETGVAVVAIAHLVGLVWAATQLRNAARAALADEIRASAAEDVAERRATAGEPGARVPHDAWARLAARAGPDAVSLAAAGGAGHESRSRDPSAAHANVRESVPGARLRLPIWHERPSVAEAGFVGWLRSRLFDRPVRADRSATLANERGARLDRLDVWLIAVLVIAVLTLRMWRLGEPSRMHFDEVYHARTATEFLQAWRYGLSHDIYEWTHPHLAKYAMAAGLVAWGGDRVRTTSELGISVADAVVEPRWDDDTDAAARRGDRLHVATGSEIVSYDLRTRAVVARTAAPGATRLALDQSDHRLYVASDDGTLSAVDLRDLDAARGTGGTATGTLAAVARLPARAALLHVADGGAIVLAALDGDVLVAVDPVTGEEVGRREIAGMAAIADAGTVPAILARPAEVTDPAAVARSLADLLGGAPADYEAALRASGESAVVTGVEPSGSVRTSVDDAIEAGDLPGVEVATVARIAVASADGVTFVGTSDLGELQTLSLPGGAQGAALVEGVDEPKLYVTTNGPDGPQYRVISVGGDGAGGPVSSGQAYPLPSAGSLVRHDESTQQVHILGAPRDGRPDGEASTLYVVEPHANAVYADTPLSFEPAAVVIDANPLYASADRDEVLAVSAAGTVASVDAGSYPFAWRLPGVLAGVLMAALLYVLARILFARRSVAILVGLLALVDGMLFVQSRIAMNDAYVAVLVVAAYTVFAAVWTGAWRWRGAFWVAMPVIGVLLGLALAAKWVAAYAIAAIVILILVRSALGRVVVVAGLIAATTVLGYMAMSVPANTPPSAGWQILGTVVQGNLTFVLIMVGLTFLAALVTVLHPIAWSVDEARFAVGAPAVAGVAIALVALAAGRADATYALGPVAVTPLQLAFALALLSIAAAATLWAAGRWGFGPLAATPPADDPARLLEPPAPAPEGWLRPGWALGLPVAWAAVSLLAIPIAVYVASYVPWAWIENHQLVEGWPAGHTGQTLIDLTGRMYDYHNTLADAHAASSPWWAWPFNLKPVWFYQHQLAAGTSASIYDAGNLPLWWLGVPAMAFCAWQAFRRRSLALALVTIAFAWQWLSWARIDRAAFQYHYYTSLPFLVLALGYFLAELWHGASRRAWLLARVAAAAAVVGPVALWLFHRPLCGFVRVLDVNKDSGALACPTFIPELVVTARSAGIAAVVGLSVLVLVRQFLTLDRREGLGQGGNVRREWGVIGVTSLAAVMMLAAAHLLLPEVPILTLRSIAVEPVAALVLVPLAAVAGVILSARDARRFVIGTVAAIVAFFAVWYPNISALPLPSQIVNAYQGFLPTYVYPFQFPVTQVSRTASLPPLLSPAPLILLAALTITCVIVAHSAWSWRIALAERAVARDGGQEAGTGPALGTSRG